jgi:hypothetical protein
MKTIKYRGKSIIDNNWVYGYYIEDDDGYPSIITNSHSLPHQVYSNTVGQFLNVVDCNGVEVYEGDMFDGIYESLYITWCDHCKQFQFHDIYDHECFACSRDLHWIEFVNDLPSVRIIGNIHESGI